MGTYCHVLVNGSQFIDDAGLIYEVPTHLIRYIRNGVLVYVPYGKNNKTITGFVLDIFEASRIPVAGTKQVHMLQTIQPVLNVAQVQLAQFLSGFYVCSTVSVIKQMIPKYFYDHCFVAIKDKHDGSILPYKEELFALVASDDFVLEPYMPGRSKEDSYNNKIFHTLPCSDLLIKDNLKNAPKQKEIYDFIATYPNCTFEVINKQYPNASSFLSKLQEKNLISFSDSFETHQDDKLTLTPSQRQILQTLSDDLRSGNFSKHLLNGVTGSGKTLIYEKLAQIAIRHKKQVLILEPEIMLSSQIFGRLKQKFGTSLALIHSKMTDRERYDVWNGIAENKFYIIVGPRSAVFMPFNDLGLIVVDEEHDDSYKQNEPDPRYHAAVCAEYLARQKNALLLLGSATPSIETLYEVIHHHCMIHNLPERANKSALPQVSLIDMKEERKKGNFSFFSKDLMLAIRNALAKDEQVILFLNKKGYASTVSCLDCGEVIKCPRCDIPLTYYKSSGSFKCSYCGYTISRLTVCPKCHSSNLDYSGIGTESIEAACATLFPGAVSARLDAQVIESEVKREKIFRDFNNNRIQILVGTQIIAKGLDFKNVSCVGIINADITLNMPDYRSSERTFQLMVQVAGRAGRHGIASQVFIQSYQTDHYALRCAVHNDLHHFFLEEMENRKKWLYPPLISLCRVLVSDLSQRKAEESVRKVANYLSGDKNTNDVILLGPAPAPLQRKNNRYRYQILLKAASRDHLRTLMQDLRKNIRQLTLRSSRVIIDMDPKAIM